MAPAILPDRIEVGDNGRPEEISMHHSPSSSMLAIVLAIGIGAQLGAATVASAQPSSVAWTSARWSSDGAFLLTVDSVIGIGRATGTHLWNARTGDLVDVLRDSAAFADDPVRKRDRNPWLIEWSERDRRVEWRRPGRHDVALTVRSATRIVEAGITGVSGPIGYVLDERGIQAWSFAGQRKLWDFSLDGFALYEFPGAGPYISAAPNGQWLAFREKSGTLQILDTATGKATKLDVAKSGVVPGPDKLSWQKWNHGALFARDGTRLWLGHSEGADIVSTRSWTVIARARPDGPCKARGNPYMYPAAENPDGNVVMLMDAGIVCTVDGQSGDALRVVDPIAEFARRNERISGSLDYGRRSLSADGQRFALYNYSADRISVWDLSGAMRMREMCTFECGKLPPHPDRRAIALTPDGSRMLVYSSTKGGPVSGVWEVDTNREVYLLRAR